VYGESQYALMSCVVCTGGFGDFGEYVYKINYNPSHYNVKTHLNKSQTFRNVQKYVFLPFGAILLTSGITIRS